MRTDLKKVRKERERRKISITSGSISAGYSNIALF